MNPRPAAMPRFPHRRRPLLASLLLAVGLAPGFAAPVVPPAPTGAVTDTFFGTAVTDPYRAMENLAAPEVQAWAKAQNDVTRATLDALGGRAALRRRLAELDDSVPSRVGTLRVRPGGLWFYEQRGANDNQFKLYVRRGLVGAGRLLVDPEAMKKADGAPVAISFYQPSDSGRFVAYGLAEGGSEEASIHVLEVATGREVGTPIDRAHYSEAAWLPDDSGFFYFRQRLLPPGTPETEKYRFQTAFFHALKGTASDRAILAAGESGAIDIKPEEFPNVLPMPGTPWVVAMPGNGVQRELTAYIAPRRDALRPGVAWRKLFDATDAVVAFEIHGDDLYLLTHKDAPRFKIVKTSVTRPDLARATEVVAAGREVVVAMASAKDGLYVQSRDGTVGKLRRVAWARDARPEPVALPAEGSIEIAASDVHLPGVVVSVGSWTHDFAYFAPDPKTGAFVDTGLQPAGPFGAPTGIESKEVLVKSHDGVEIPLSIVYPKGITLDGSHPTLLYGYGSYGITDDPVYVPRFLAWYELGGVRATCHVRGGGAYGEDWHLAGKQATKPNTWKDFIACGEYLVREGYTTSAKLAINGGSAGGILVGRAMTERPDLFAVAVPEVGVMNTMRAEFSANGVPNIPEFGTVKDEAQFRGLYEMDALQHVKDGTAYPATLVNTGINDPRVPPWQSFKMVARLQAATSSGKPVLLRVDYAGGHGMGSTKVQRQESYADVWSFMLWQFGDPRFQPVKQ